MAEFGDLLSFSSDNQEVKVEVEWLDYSFVNECKDVKKLKAILSVLTSGKEGHYPDLIRCTEERLMSLLPDAERKRILRVKSEASQDEIREAELDLQQFTKKVAAKDSLLKKSSIAKPAAEPSKDIFDTTPNTSTASLSRLPPIRGQTQAQTQSASIKKTVDRSFADSSSSSSSSSSNKAPDEKKIGGYDFKAWEKFDVDKAIEKIDKEDENRSKQVKQQSDALASAAMDAASRRAKAYQKEIQDMSEKHKIATLSEGERLIKAERESSKGSEFFKAGDFEKSYDCYTLSIALNPKNHLTYANRAAASIRLSTEGKDAALEYRLNSADDDCSQALKIDKTHVKSWFRRGSARLKLGKFKEAAEDFVHAVYLDPKNSECMKLFDTAKRKLAEVQAINIDFETMRRQIEARETGKPFIEPTSTPVAKSAASTSSTSATSSTSSQVKSQAVPPAGSNIEYVDDFKKMQLLSSSAVKLSEGVCRVAVISSQSSDKPSGSFTRIAITEDDDDDDDDDVKQESNTQATISQQSSNAGFTRIAISEDDDDDDDDEGIEVQKVVEKSVPASGFTRIAISEDDDSEGDDEVFTVPITDGRANPNLVNYSANELKDQGNAFVSEKKFDKAIEAYTKALQKDPSFLVAKNNRSSVYLELKQYKNCIEDATAVLVMEPTNLKALFRRAAAYQGQSLDLDDGDDRKVDMLLNARTDLNTLSSLQTNSQNSTLLLTVEKSLSQISVKWKEMGNDALKSGDLNVAIDCFSRSLECDGNNITARCNRSLALNKAERYKEGERDASDVIAALTSNDGKDVEDAAKLLPKAYYRRGVSRKALGGVDNLTLAIEDFSQSSRMNPEDKLVVKERDAAQQLLKALKSNSSSPSASASKPAPANTMPPSPPPSTPSEGDGIMKAVASRKITRAPDEPPQPPAPSTSTANSTSSTTPTKPIESSSTSSSASVSPASAASSPNTSKSSKSSKALSPAAISLSVPTEIPKTAYEMERIWRGLKSRPELFAQYLGIFKKSSFKKIFKTSISQDLMSSMLVTIRDHVDSLQASKILLGISETPSFDMSISVMMAEDEACLIDIFNKMASDASLADTLKELRDKYKVY